MNQEAIKTYVLELIENKVEESDQIILEKLDPSTFMSSYEINQMEMFYQDDRMIPEQIQKEEENGKQNRKRKGLNIDSESKYEQDLNYNFQKEFIYLKLKMYNIKVINFCILHISELGTETN
ncbi:hypothetical protein ABPG72_015664 [Tetrahymena utriculariae]